MSSASGNNKFNFSGYNKYNKPNTNGNYEQNNNYGKPKNYGQNNNNSQNVNEYKKKEYDDAEIRAILASYKTIDDMSDFRQNAKIRYIKVTTPPEDDETREFMTGGLLNFVNTKKQQITLRSAGNENITWTVSFLEKKLDDGTIIKNIFFQQYTILELIEQVNDFANTIKLLKEKLKKKDADLEHLKKKLKKYKS